MQNDNGNRYRGERCESSKCPHRMLRKHASQPSKGFKGSSNQMKQKEKAKTPNWDLCGQSSKDAINPVGVHSHNQTIQIGNRKCPLANDMHWRRQLWNILLSLQRIYLAARWAPHQRWKFREETHFDPSKFSNWNSSIDSIESSLMDTVQRIEADVVPTEWKAIRSGRECCWSLVLLSLGWNLLHQITRLLQWLIEVNSIKRQRNQLMIFEHTQQDKSK